MSTSIMPTPAQTAGRAKEILAAITADVEFGAFEAATLEYSSDWQASPASRSSSAGTSTRTRRRCSPKGCAPSSSRPPSST